MTLGTMMTFPKKLACGFTKISPEVLKKLREFSTFDAIGFGFGWTKVAQDFASVSSHPTFALS